MAAPARVQAGIDQVYFNVLILRYEQVAVLSYEQWWEGDARQSPGLGDDNESGLEGLTASLEARNLAADLCRRAAEEIDLRALAARRDFVERHHIDYPDHSASFKSRHPSRDLIFAEIPKIAEVEARSVGLEWSKKLVDEEVRLTRLSDNAVRSATREEIEEQERRFWDFRLQLIRKEVPKVILKMRLMAKKMPSVRALAEEVK